VRFNVEDFGLHSTTFIDAAAMDHTFGGYSGGFADGTWACFRSGLVALRANTN
jgi:hypothetical protein